eukprot:snap_masked-scaffold_14-processed-gene-9.28-mRNA-1 protein AED:0.05 eAED:0.05 QI:0/-1/0/1/-1/1/1/0/161
MTELFDYLEEPNKKSPYLDKVFYKTHEEQKAAKASSLTLYVGNLSFYTAEEQIYNLFSMVCPGRVEKVIMGLHKTEKAPCGFCFVLFKDRKSLLDCNVALNHTALDGKRIKIEVDHGFKEGRQYGRGKFGGQKSDERRHHFDAQRRINVPEPRTNFSTFDY